jgi:hypothetical protein
VTDTKLVKSAGEHWACTVLSRLGWAVALTRDGLARTDVLGVHPPTGRMIEVQVKASSPSSTRFMLGAKGCDPAITDREWYVLVALPAVEWESARTYVVPRDHVAAATWIEHQEWLTNPNAAAGKRNTPIAGARVNAWVFARYEQRWDLLDLPTSEVPVMLPPRFREWGLGDRVGLRPDHPWSSDMPSWDTSAVSDSWPEWALEASAAG